MKFKSLLLAGSMISAAVTSPAAILVQFDTGAISDLSPSISSADLLQTHLASSSITGFDPVATYAPTLPNGGDLFDGESGAISGGFAFGPTYIDNSTGSAWSATFTLDTVANPFGYNISEIHSFSGWNSGLAAQDFTISYSLVGEENFIELGRFTQAASNTGLVVHILDDLGGFLVSGVDEIRFTHHTGTGDARGSYRELDIIGVAIPEPGTIALFAGVAGLALAVTRKRKR